MEKNSLNLATYKAASLTSQHKRQREVEYLAKQYLRESKAGEQTRMVPELGRGPHVPHSRAESQGGPLPAHRARPGPAQLPLSGCTSPSSVSSQGQASPHPHPLSIPPIPTPHPSTATHRQETQDCRAHGGWALGCPSRAHSVVVTRTVGQDWWGLSAAEGVSAGVAIGPVIS